MNRYSIACGMNVENSLIAVWIPVSSDVQELTFVVLKSSVMLLNIIHTVTD